MHVILSHTRLSPNVVRLQVQAPRIAQIRQAGQFVIVCAGPRAERIPLTIADADAEQGWIALIIQAVGKTTRDLAALGPGDTLRDIAGPLGRPTDLFSQGRALCVGGGVGTAVLYPIAQALHRRGVAVTSIIGGRSQPWVILEPELRQQGAVIVCTNDGSLGRPGMVTDIVREQLAAQTWDRVYAVGPVPMMRAVVQLTRAAQVPTIVSLNPIMVDGTGMCGGCRVMVGGQTRFACVDGPEFDGHQINFELLSDRLETYRLFEQEANHRQETLHAGPCRLGLATTVS